MLQVLLLERQDGCCQSLPVYKKFKDCVKLNVLSVFCCYFSFLCCGLILVPFTTDCINVKSKQLAKWKKNDSEQLVIIFYKMVNIKRSCTEITCFLFLLWGKNQPSFKGIHKFNNSKSKKYWQWPISRYSYGINLKVLCHTLHKLWCSHCSKPHIPFTVEG